MDIIAVYICVLYIEIITMHNMMQVFFILFMDYNMYTLRYAFFRALS